MDISKEKTELPNEPDTHSEAELPVALVDRYRFALRFVEPTSRVLDCACGNGYGADFLSKLAEDVLGVDTSNDAIRFCRARYASSPVRFEKGDAEALLLEDGSIDLYTCFETIEYVANPEKLLAEAKRVLAPNGVFLISTLNRHFPAQPAKEGEVRHLRDWSFTEFGELLNRFFPHVRHYVQHVESANKFSAKYIISRGKRLMGIPDVSAVGSDEKSRQRLEEGKPWNPMTLISACRLNR